MPMAHHMRRSPTVARLVFVMCAALIAVTNASPSWASGGSGSPPAPFQPAPAGVRSRLSTLTRSYVSALSSHHWPRACALMLPALRRFERSLAFFYRPHSCAAALWRAEHMGLIPTAYGELHKTPRHWRSARILRLGPILVSGGLAEVDLRLVQTYACHIPRRSRYCLRPAYRFIRPDRLYFLRNTSGSWRIAKGGAVISDIEDSRPEANRSWSWPPAQPGESPVTAYLPASPPGCAGLNPVSQPDPVGDVKVVEEPEPRIVDIPWLDITSVAVTHGTSPGACVSIGLTDAPRADSLYYFYWFPKVGKRASVGSGGGSFGVEFDARGLPHATVDRNISLLKEEFLPLPRIGYQDESLEVELTSRQDFTTERTWEFHFAATNRPLSEDPLSGYRESAEDRAPDERCLQFPGDELTIFKGCSDQPGP